MRLRKIYPGHRITYLHFRSSARLLFTRTDLHHLYRSVCAACSYESARRRRPHTPISVVPAFRYMEKRNLLVPHVLSLFFLLTPLQSRLFPLRAIVSPLLLVASPRIPLYEEAYFQVPVPLRTDAETSPQQ